MASPPLRLGRHLPARDRGWQSHPLPDRAQPVVNDLLVLIVDSLDFMYHFSTLRACFSARYRVAQPTLISQTLDLQRTSRIVFYILSIFLYHFNSHRLGLTNSRKSYLIKVSVTSSL
jgi:hypothetical protein